MSSAKTARWLDLIAFLLQRRTPATRAEIFERVHGYTQDDDGPSTVRRRGQGEEEIRRKFERDKDELRSLGIEIETVPLPDARGDEPASGYRLRPGDFYLPYVELHETTVAPGDRPYPGVARIALSRAELAILDRATQLVAQRTESALGKAAASARRKLEFDLPLSQSAVERVLAVALDAEGSRSLGVLQHAVADQVAVRCHYHSIGRDQSEERLIEPYGLFFNWGRWYCVALARDRASLRVFRVDRMRQVALLTGREARFDVPPDFSIGSYLGRAPWALSGGEPVNVRVRFSFPESRWVQAQQVGEVIEPMLDDGGAVLQFAVQDRNPFLRWLLTFRRHAQVESPDSVRIELEHLHGRVARLYAGKP